MLIEFKGLETCLEKIVWEDFETTPIHFSSFFLFDINLVEKSFMGP